jgi:hypothetical protein
VVSAKFDPPVMVLEKKIAVCTIGLCILTKMTFPSGYDETKYEGISLHAEMARKKLNC